jgi:hypothetical protein
MLQTPSTGGVIMAKKVKKRVAKKAAMKVLPMKMSALIKIALADIRKAEKLKKEFFVDMGNWLLRDELVCTVGVTTISETPICVACAAGSVMAFTLGQRSKLRDGHEIVPEDLPDNVNQLHAIDELRQGDVLGAAAYLGLIEREGYYDDYPPDKRAIFNKLEMKIPAYVYHKTEPFHKAMAKLQQKLVKAGY